MTPAFFTNFRKTLIDAKTLGVADEKSEMLINDFLKVIANEIKTKEESIYRLRGEIVSLNKMFDLWNNIIASHIRNEKQNILNQERVDSMMNQEETEKPKRKRRTKKEIEAAKK